MLHSYIRLLAVALGLFFLSACGDSDRVQKMDTRILELEKRLAAADVLAKAAGARLDGESDKIQKLDARISEDEKRLAAAETQTKASETRLDGESDKIQKLDARISEQIHQADVHVAEHEKRLAAAEGQLAKDPATKVDARVSDVEKRLSADEDLFAKISAAKLAADVSNLENRLAVAEARTEKVTGIPPPTPEAALRYKQFTIRKLQSEFVRYTLLREVHAQDVRSAQTFLDLTDAREKAGQVTKLDVFNADMCLRTRELALISTARLQHEAELDLKEVAGDSAKKLMEVPALDFGFISKDKDVRMEIASDERAGTVNLVAMKAEKPISTTLLFQATRIENEILKAVENAPAGERPRFRRKLDTALGLLQQYEKDVLVTGRAVEAGKRSVEAAQISFDRGLKDSFDVIRTQDDLHKAQIEFITRKLDYAIQQGQIEYLLAGDR